MDQYNNKNFFQTSSRKFRQKTFRAGFALIYAVLISSLLVAIAVSISNLVIKQLSISTVSRESQIAFYAADSGAECALYWDIQGPYWASPFSFPSPDNQNPLNLTPLSCGVSVECYDDIGQSVSCPYIKSFGTYYQSRFIVHFGNPSPCAIVSIKKKSDYTTTSNVIDSYGINDCSTTDNQYRVERALRVNYK